MSVVKLDGLVALLEGFPNVWCLAWGRADPGHGDSAAFFVPTHREHLALDLNMYVT